MVLTFAMHDCIVLTPILHIKKLSCNSNDYITICVSSNNYIEMNNMQWLSTNACMCKAYTYEYYDYAELAVNKPLLASYRYTGNTFATTHPIHSQLLFQYNNMKKV